MDVVTVTNELSTVANKWHLIASVFKFSTTYIDKLKSDEDKSDQEKLGIIISDWIGGNCPCPTWYLLGNALRHASVEEGELANSIDGKYNVATGPTGNYNNYNGNIQTRGTASSQCLVLIRGASYLP